MYNQRNFREDLQNDTWRVAAGHNAWRAPGTHFPPVSLDLVRKHGVQLGQESNANNIQVIPCFRRTDFI